MRSISAQRVKWEPEKFLNEIQVRLTEVTEKVIVQNSRLDQLPRPKQVGKKEKVVQLYYFYSLFPASSSSFSTISAAERKKNLFIQFLQPHAFSTATLCSCLLVVHCDVRFLSKIVPSVLRNATKMYLLSEVLCIRSYHTFSILSPIGLSQLPATFFSRAHIYFHFGERHEACTYFSVAQNQHNGAQREPERDPGSDVVAATIHPSIYIYPSIHTILQASNSEKKEKRLVN